jgi:hypothetical protein
MLGVLDFRDAFIKILFDNKACVKVPLANFRKTRIGIDYLQIIDYLIHCHDRMNYAKNLSEMKEKLKILKIDLAVVEPGLIFLEKTQLVRPFYKARWYREKFYYSLNIFKVVFMNDQVALEKFSEIMKLSVIGNSDNFTLFFYHHLFSNQISKAFKQSEIPIIRAPQLTEIQLDYMRYSNLIEHIQSSPLVYVFGDFRNVIKNIDFETNSVTLFDFNALASFYKVKPSHLRKALIGSLLYFLNHQTFAKETKSTLATNEEVDFFKEKYKQLSEENMKLLDKQIRFLLTEIEDDIINLEFIDKISSIFGFDKSTLRNMASFFLNGPVITHKASIRYYPGILEFSESRFLISKNNSFLTILFCKKFIEEDILSLFNSCSENKVGVYFPRYNFIEHHYAYKSYYKNSLEFIISKIYPFLKTHSKKEFQFQYFKEEVETLELSSSQNFIMIHSFQLTGHFSFSRVIFDYYEFLYKSKNTNKPIEGLIADKKFIFSQICLNFLHDLRYIDIRKGSILIPGAAFAKTLKHSFDVEIIILFELLRNNLLSNEYSDQATSMLDDYRQLFQNNYFESMVDVSNELKSLLNSMQVEPYEVNNYLSVVHDNSPIDSTEIDVLNTSGLSLESNFKQNLKQGIKKTLSMFYKVIKSFEIQYKKFRPAEFSETKYEKILKYAFRDKALKKIQIISRILTFAKTDLSIENLYDLDMYQFQQIINIVIKSLRNILSANFIAYLYETKQVENFNLVQSIFSKFLFEETYSLDAATLAKLVITQCLIYESLRVLKDPFEAEYRENLKLEYLKKTFNIQFDFIDYLLRGKALLVKVFTMISNIDQHSPKACFKELSSKGDAILDAISISIRILTSINKSESV